MNKSHLLLLIATSFLTFNTNAASDQPKPANVTVQTIDSLKFYPVRTAPAKVLSLNNSKIPARVNGVLERINVRVGDAVKQGDILARLDCQANELLLDQLVAQTEGAKIAHEFRLRELTRAKKLQQDQALSEAQVDQIQTDAASSTTQFNGLKAQLANQQLTVSYCDIKAPFDALVTARPVSVGEQVNIGQVVAVLLQSNHLEVSAQIPHGDSEVFSAANRYWFEINQQQHPLKLRQLLSVIENNSRSQEARFEFVQQHAISGATGRVKWQTPTPYLPAYLLQQRDGHYGYFIFADNKAKFIAIDDASEGRPIALQGDEQFNLIIDGRLSLNDQDPVAITQANSKTAASQ